MRVRKLEIVRKSKSLESCAIKKKWGGDRRRYRVKLFFKFDRIYIIKVAIFKWTVECQ